MSISARPADRMAAFDFDVVTDAPPLRSQPPERAAQAPRPPERVPAAEQKAANPR